MKLEITYHRKSNILAAGKYAVKKCGSGGKLMHRQQQYSGGQVRSAALTKSGRLRLPMNLPRYFSPFIMPGSESTVIFPCMMKCWHLSMIVDCEPVYFPTRAKDGCLSCGKASMGWQQAVKSASHTGKKTLSFPASTAAPFQSADEQSSFMSCTLIKRRCFFPPGPALVADGIYSREFSEPEELRRRQ